MTEPPETETFGSLLRSFRVRASLSRNALAQRAGIDPSYLSRFEHGQRSTPKRALLDALVRTLNLRGADRSQLMALAGFMPWKWSPSLDEFAEWLARRANQ